LAGASEAGGGTGIVAGLPLAGGPSKGTMAGVAGFEGEATAAGGDCGEAGNGEPGGVRSTAGGAAGNDEP
jgi:hypothetical protein